MRYVAQMMLEVWEIPIVDIGYIHVFAKKKINQFMQYKYKPIKIKRLYSLQLKIDFINLHYLVLYIGGSRITNVIHIENLSEEIRCEQMKLYTCTKANRFTTRKSISEMSLSIFATYYCCQSTSYSQQLLT